MIRKSPTTWSAQQPWLWPRSYLMKTSVGSGSVNVTVLVTGHGSGEKQGVKLSAGEFATFPRI